MKASATESALRLGVGAALNLCLVYLSFLPWMSKWRGPYWEKFDTEGLQWLLYIALAATAAVAVAPLFMRGSPRQAVFVVCLLCLPAWVLLMAFSRAVQLLI